MKTLVLAGMPRCGTTYLFRCLMGLPPGSGSPKGRAMQILPAIKCHSLAPPAYFNTDPWADDVRECLVNDGRAIFVYGDPYASVISTMRHRFDHVHARNCGCDLPLGEVNLLEADFFNYERMFDSWVVPHDYRVMVVRYETMPSHRRDIEYFVGQKVKWNEWNSRSTDISSLPEHIKQRLELVYGRLKAKVNKAPDCALM